MGKGWVYWLRAGDWFKIGFTRADDFLSRAAALQTGCPEEIVPVAAVRGDECLERQIHAHLAKWRAPGGSEWFAANQETIDALMFTFDRCWRDRGWFDLPGHAERADAIDFGRLILAELTGTFPRPPKPRTGNEVYR